MLCYAVLYCAVLNCTVLCCAVLYCAVLHCAVLCCEQYHLGTRGDMVVDLEDKATGHTIQRRVHLSLAGDEPHPLTTHSPPTYHPLTTHSPPTHHPLPPTHHPLTTHSPPAHQPITTRILTRPPSSSLLIHCPPTTHSLPTHYSLTVQRIPLTWRRSMSLLTHCPPTTHSLYSESLSPGGGQCSCYREDEGKAGTQYPLT